MRVQEALMQRFNADSGSSVRFAGGAFLLVQPEHDVWFFTILPVILSAMGMPISFLSTDGNPPSNL
jgi:hypothetical protein